MRRSHRAIVLAVCVLLAVLHTWPLALHPGRYSQNDNADTQLNEWILAWVAHQLPRDPLNLFEANIFYPAHDALAFSEPLLVPALMGAPIAWLGGSPVLVYNLVLIAGFALTAFVTCMLVRAWTGSIAAGLVAGSVFAFNTHTLTRLPHMQAIHLYGLPLALLAIDRIMEDGSRRAALLLAGALALLAYTSGYLIVFALIMLPVAVLVRAPEWWPRARHVAAALAIAAVAGALAIVPVYLPYRRVAIEQHMTRPLEVVQDYSTSLSGYLATAGRLHHATWSARFFDGGVDSFFPGFVIIGLAAFVVVTTMRRRGIFMSAPGAAAPSATMSTAPSVLRWRVAMLAAIGLAGVILSLGTQTPVYRWLFAIFPPIRSLRAASRFGNLFLLAVSVLGGIAVSWTQRRWVAIALLVLVNIESLRAPIAYEPFTGIPGVYKEVAREGSSVVLAEVPFWPRAGIFQNGPYELGSTANWRPLMNGYSGYTPDSYDHYAETFWLFPDDRAIASMRAAGVTHIIAHMSRFNDDESRQILALEARGALELVAISRGELRLYRLK
jgi:hypothetical protein